MKKKAFLLTLILLISFQILGQDIFKYDMELVHTFTRGKGKDQLMTVTHVPSQNGPTAFTFDKKGNLYISNTVMDRLVKFDINYKFVEEYLNVFNKLKKNNKS